MNLRRILHAIAAVAVAAIVVVAPAGTAHADPDQPCSIEEWRNPANFGSCAKRLQVDVTRRAECLTPPTPSSPTSGAAGWFSNRPDNDLRSGITGQFSTYGVAGYQLEVYDMTCLGAAANPAAVGQTAFASMLFTTAAALVGAAGGLRELAYEPGKMWDWSDEVVEDLTEMIFEYLFTPIGAVMVAGTGLWLLWLSRQGRLSHAVKIVGWSIVVVVVVTGVARWPVHAAHAADGAASTGLKVIHSVVGPAPKHIAPDRCVFPEDPDACQDHRTTAVRASDTAVEAILYRNWLRAVLGSADSKTARTYGPALYDAATISWSEAADIEKDPGQRQAAVSLKASQWMAIAEKIRVEDPEAYEHLRGARGTDRVVTSIVTLLSAVIYVIFDMLASFVILLGFLIFRVAVIALPVVGTIGVAYAFSGPFIRVVNTVVAAMFNIMIFGAGGGTFLTVVDKIFNSDLPAPAQLFGVGLTAVALTVLLRPWRNVLRILGAPEAADSAGPVGRVWRRLKEGHETPQSGPETHTEPPAGSDSARTRPEATAGRFATAAASVVGLVRTVQARTAPPGYTPSTTQRPEAR